MNRTNCPDFEILSACLDGEISHPDRERLEIHMKNCSSCKQKYNELHILRNNFEPLRNQIPQIDIVADVKRKIEISSDSTRKGCFGWLPIGLVPFAMAASLALFIGIELGSRLVIEKNTLNMTSTAQMALFSVMPPGNICLGHASCYTWRDAL